MTYDDTLIASRAMVAYVMDHLGLSEWETEVKCATSFSSVDYGAIMHVYAAATRGNASANVDVDIEWRERGGVWRPLGLEVSLRTASQASAFFELQPYAIIPPNSDVRMVATSDTANTQVAGRFTTALLLKS